MTYAEIEQMAYETELRRIRTTLEPSLKAFLQEARDATDPTAKNAAIGRWGAVDDAVEALDDLIEGAPASLQPPTAPTGG